MLSKLLNAEFGRHQWRSFGRFGSAIADNTMRALSDNNFFFGLFGSGKTISPV
jgi:hypothetical protein